MKIIIDQLNLKRYSAYRDSGVEWLGEIPQHWKRIRMKYLFHDYSEKNREEEELLSVTQNQGVVPRTWVSNRMVMPSGNLESFKFIQKGDFAISLRSFEGGLEYCYHDGIISPAYTVLKAQRNIYDIYYKYLFKSFAFISELQTSVVGIREGKNISYPQLSYSSMPIPTLEEQTQIANFLDDKCTKIDQAIQQKERLIELLKERKQIIIQNAVTRGLNPKVKMKDSGVDWIGEIPEGWEVKRLKHVLRIKNGQDYKHIVADTGYPVIGSGGQFAFAKEYLYDGEALLLGRKGTIDKPLYVNSKFWTVDTMFYAVVNKSNSTRYMHYLATTIPFKFYSTSTALPSMTQNDLNNHKIVIPPLTEQLLILDFLDNQKIKLNKAINYQKQQIEKLKEYKQVLINEVVTGKVKV